jgi:hypothetical protein
MAPMSTNIRDTLLFSLGTAVLVAGVMLNGEADAVSGVFRWLTSFF